MNCWPSLPRWHQVSRRSKCAFAPTGAIAQQSDRTGARTGGLDRFGWIAIAILAAPAFFFPARRAPMGHTKTGPRVHPGSLCCTLWRRAVQVGAFAFALLTAVSGSFAQGNRPLPGGERTSLGEFRAYLIEPTSNYEHGVLGDSVEARGFAIETGGRVLTYKLPFGPVFEDRRVRLADINDDGRPEAIVIKSYPDRGSALAAYQILHDRIVPLAESTAIGQRHRWLNPVGIGNFTGSNEVMIVAVVTPHRSGSLRLYRLAGTKLEPIARIDGFTNHVMGSTDLDLGRAIDLDADGALEIVLPSTDRLSLAVISFLDEVARVRNIIPLPGRLIRIEALDQDKAAILTESGPAVLKLR
jgi:hypothetical protein